MCGIVGYVGHQPAAPRLLSGLYRMEYRGYDSAGLAVLDGRLVVHKRSGNVSVLAQALAENAPTGTIGIAHTRWATHGPPTNTNAHPHLNTAGTLALVHNGIIENHVALRQYLAERGCRFISETDTEVLVHLIHYLQHELNTSVETAVRAALGQVVGTYGLLLIAQDNPGQIIAARRGSPLLIGVGQDEYFVASDAAAFLEHTQQTIQLEDGDVAILQPTGHGITTIDNKPRAREISTLDLTLQQIEKGGYKHFMLKEIMEQPAAIENCLRGRVDADGGRITLGGLHEVMEELRTARRIIIAGCGTSWHAGLIGCYLIEALANIPVSVEYASEFCYRNPVLAAGDIMFVISQSGETADTKAAAQLARERQIPVYGICNVVGSSIARLTDGGVYLHAGPEIGVASTKAFTAQVAVLTMIALKLAEGRMLDESGVRRYLSALAAIPGQMRQVLELSEHIRQIAQTFWLADNFLYLGRGYHFPVALEGALKLKEISYIHAEGYPAAEMKHGSIALIDQFMPVAVIAMRDKLYAKVMSNVEEVKTRGARLIIITDEGNMDFDNSTDYIIRIPITEAPLQPLLSVIPLQLLAYHIALLRGCDVDRPRNLAKSVTVE